MTDTRRRRLMIFGGILPLGFVGLLHAQARAEEAAIAPQDALPLSHFGMGGDAIRAWIAACHAQSLPGVLSEPFSLSEPVTITGIDDLDLRSKGLGEIRFSGAGKLSFVNCRNAMVSLSHRGTLSTRVQFELVQDGLQGLFAKSADWTCLNSDDGSVEAVIDGNDFNHSYAAGLLSLSFGSGIDVRGRAAKRKLLSSHFGLDPASRYIIVPKDGILGGTGGALELEFRTYDASGKPVDVANGSNGRYSIDNTGIGWRYCWLTGASSIRVGAGIRRDSQAPMGLMATFDLSKLRIFKLVNDYAVQSDQVGLDEALIQFSNCTNPRWIGGESRDHIGAGVQFVTCENPVLIGLKSSGVINAVNASGNTGLEMVAHESDGRMLTTDGEWLFDQAIRGRAFNGSRNSGLIRRNCRSIGHHWACESLNLDGGKMLLDACQDHAFGAPLSILAPHPDTKISNCIMIAAPGARYGLEMPGTRKASAQGQVINPTIIFESLDWRGFGISATTLKDVVVVNPDIQAPMGAQALASSIADAPNRFRVIGGSIKYASQAIFGQNASVMLEEVNTRRVSNQALYNIANAPALVAFAIQLGADYKDRKFSIIGGVQDTGSRALTMAATARDMTMRTDVVDLNGTHRITHEAGYP